MAGRRDENGNNRSGVKWRTLIAVLGVALTVVVVTITFFVSTVAAQSGLDKRIGSLEENRVVMIETLVEIKKDVSDLKKSMSQLEHDRATTVEKLSNIEKGVERIERKVYGGGG